MKMIGIDLDGTLLNSRQRISARNITALKEATSTMFPFICSGRDLEDIQNILRESNLNIPAVGLNGALAFDQKQQLFDVALNSAIVAKIYDIISKFPTKIYTNLGSYESAAYPENLKRTFTKLGAEFSSELLKYELDYEKTVKSTPFNQIQDILNIDGIKIYKFFIFIPNQELKSKIKAELALISDIIITESAAINLEINPQNASKGLAFNHLQKHYKFDQVSTFAIGDGMNDLSMFQVADYSFAMANGHPYIKKIANAITVTNDEDGVAQALDKIKMR